MISKLEPFAENPNVPYVFSRNGKMIKNPNYNAEAVLIAALGSGYHLYAIRAEQIKILFGWDAQSDDLAKMIAIEFSSKPDEEFLEYAIKITGEKDLILPEVCM